jgi:diaminohydroxyphosphoribosylaminopyrimidine deaminase/5-amino-6-(5-phosphoribosylamino)uracil reductase
VTIPEAMALAINEANKGWGRVSPNPLVGCVILSESGSVISTGAHLKWGEAHAEINALSVVDEKWLVGATVVVTLEPCSHQGKTGSCAVALSKLPVKRIVFGIEDPNPLVAGKGQKILIGAGKGCDLFEEVFPERVELIKGLRSLPEHFLKNQTAKQAFLALKYAVTTDGFMVDDKGNSKWITNEVSREYVHYLRGGFDSILTTSKTLLTDMPKLNVRHGENKGKKIKLLVLDASLETLGKDIPALSGRTPEDVVYCIPQNSQSGEKVRKYGHGVIEYHGVDSAISEIKTLAYQMGVCSIFTEAGPTLISEILKAEEWDRIYSFVGNKEFGSGRGPFDKLDSKKRSRLKSFLNGATEVLDFNGDQLISASRIGFQ